MGVNDLVKELMYIYSSICENDNNENGKIKYNIYKGSEIALPFSEPYRENVNIYKLESFYKKMYETKNMNLHGLIVLKNGKIISEGYKKPYSREICHISFSMSKSVVGMAVGICISRGLFNINDKVIDILFKSKKKEGIKSEAFISDLELDKINKNFFKLKIGNLLNMSSGITFNELNTINCENWLQEILKSDFNFEPGTRFQYNSINTYLLSVIIRISTKKTLTDFLGENIFSLIGIGDVFFELCPLGIEKGGWGMKMTLNDISKLGQLCLNKGMWNNNGKTIKVISRKWVEKSTKISLFQKTAAKSSGYGYQNWILENGFLFNGLFGQNVFVFPKENMVIAMNGGSHSSFPSGITMDIVQEFIKENKNADNNTNIGKLINENIYFKKQLGKIFYNENYSKKNNFVEFNKYFSFCNEIKCRKYFFNNNNLRCFPYILQIIYNDYSDGVYKVDFLLHNKQLIIVLYENNNIENKINIGFFSPEYSIFKTKNNNYLVGAYGRIGYDKNEGEYLFIELSFVEMINSVNFKFFFKNDGSLVVRVLDTPDIRYIYNKIFNDKEGRNLLSVNMNYFVMKSGLGKIFHNSFNGILLTK